MASICFRGTRPLRLSTSRSRSAQRPRARKALTNTLVSKAAGAAGFGADGLELLLQVGFQTDGERVGLHARHCRAHSGGGLAHTSVQFREENGRVLIEKATPSPSPGEDAIQRLHQSRVCTRLSTEELLALTRGEDP